MTLLHYLGHSRRRWWCHCKCVSDGASAIKGHSLGGEGIRLWRGNRKSTATFWRPSAFFGLLHLVLLSWCTTTQLLYSACTAFIAIPRRTCCKYPQPSSHKVEAMEGEKEEGKEWKFRMCFSYSFCIMGSRCLGGRSFSMAGYASPQKMLVGHNNTNTLQQKRNGGVAPSTIPKWLHPHFYTDVSQK